MQKINCEKCNYELGEMSDDGVYPCSDTSVEIKEGWVHFQCPNDGDYIKVRENNYNFTLYRPGTKRIF